MWYGFGGRLRKTNWPAESVVVLRLNPVTGLVSSTVTATITPPVGSFTVPCTVPEPPSCASAGSARDSSDRPRVPRRARARELDDARDGRETPAARRLHRLRATSPPCPAEPLL